MELIEKIKNQVGLFILKRNIKSLKRNKCAFNLDTAKEIGILVNAKDAKVYEDVCRLIKYLMDNKIKVHSLSYVEKPEVFDLYSRQMGMLYFTKTDLNWYKKPSNHHINDFMNARFDILIDLTLEDFYPLQYIVNLSPAKYKVGRFTSEDSVYDLMINLKKGDNVEFLIKQIVHYLTILKTK